MNRVGSATATGTYGTQGYTYDGVGNRLTLTVGGTTSTYAYSSSANQIATVTTGSNVRSFSYQPTGQVSRDQRDTSDIYAFAANDNGRNASATLNTTMVGAYLYNAFEQRVQKTAGSATTQFVFDRFGHLLEEANASGVVQKEYIWLDDVPVAVVDDAGAAPVLYYIHTDQLGTPQKITNGSAVVVWDGVFDPFGNAQFVSGGGVWDTSQWDNFLWGASLTLTNLRFPGQYADTETALNQNWFRDYDPTIGRYIQSDPIGLFGGANTYAYLDSKPLVEKDSLGLQAIPFPIFPPPAASPYAPQVPSIPSINPQPPDSNTLQRNQEEEEEAQAEYNRMGDICNSPVEPGSNECSTLSKQIDHANRCISLLQAWDAKWGPGIHDNKIATWQNRLRNLKSDHNRKCTQKCP